MYSIDVQHGSRQNNEWHQVEDGIKWPSCPDKKVNEWTEKAVFYFWEQPADETNNNACPVLQDAYDYLD